MRHLFKNSLVALIVMSFVFTPEVFAKPTGRKYNNTKDLNRVLKLVKKSSKKGLKLSSFLETTKPLLKRKVYKRIARDAMPFWDRKASNMVIGNDYVFVKYKGKTIIAKYVDRGPMAFIVNSKPLLWKDLLTYDKTKARLEEILNPRKAKKVSVLDKFFGKLSSFAFAITKEEECRDIFRGVSTVDDQFCGSCIYGYTAPNNPITGNPMSAEDLNSGDFNTQPCTPQQVITPVVAPEPEPVITAEEDEFNWTPIVLFGAAAFLIFMLSRRNRNRNNDDDPSPDPDPEPPVIGWTPEGSCPTPGARGLTPADLPPECRASGCESTNSCAGGSGSLDTSSETYRGF